MNRSFRRWVVPCIVLCAGLAGCAHQPGELRSLDTERLQHAIATDDAGYVVAALRSQILSPSQRIPALGYREGAPLLTVAARYGAVQVLRALVAAGADVNARTPDGDTALMLASFFFNEDRQQGINSNDQHEKAVRLLVEAGAQLENHPHHYTPLAYAAYQGHERIVRYLMARGARVDGDADRADDTAYVNTPLMMAAIQGHLETAVSLLRGGANPRIRVFGGRTAAEFAERYNHQELARVLRCAERIVPGEAYTPRCEQTSAAAAQSLPQR